MSDNLEVDKAKIKEWVTRILEEEDRKESAQVLNEYNFAVDWSSNQFIQSFIDPWVKVLKVISGELQRTLANVVLTLKLIFTFNSEKAKLLVAKHNDRMKALEAKIDESLGPLKEAIPGEFHVYAFFAAPGLYLTSQALDKGGPTAGGGAIAHWFREAGVGDWTAGELADDSPDREQDRLERQRGEAGMITKALKGLEQIFLLGTPLKVMGAGYDASGNILLEQEEKEVETETVEETAAEPDMPDISQINQGLQDTGLDELAKEGRNALMESYSEFESALDLFQKQADLLSDVALSMTVEELETNLQALSAAIPDMDLSEFETFKTNISQNIESLSQDEKHVKEVAVAILSASGKSDPTEEDINNVDRAKVEQKISNDVYGGGTSELRSKIMDQLINSTQIYVDLLEKLKLPKGSDSKLQALIDKSDFGKKAKKVQDKMNGISQYVSQVEGKIKSAKEPAQQ